MHATHLKAFPCCSPGPFNPRRLEAFNSSDLKVIRVAMAQISQTLFDYY